MPAIGEIEAVINPRPSSGSIWSRRPAFERPLEPVPNRPMASLPVRSNIRHLRTSKSPADPVANLRRIDIRL